MMRKRVLKRRNKSSWISLVNLYRWPDMTVAEDLIPGQRLLMGLKR